MVSKKAPEGPTPPRRANFKPEKEGPTPTQKADPNPKKEGPTPTRRANPCLLFFPNQHLNKNMDFVCNYSLLPQKAGQPQAQDRRANPDPNWKTPTARRKGQPQTPTLTKEGPTPTRRANPTPKGQLQHREGRAGPQTRCFYYNPFCLLELKIIISIITIIIKL